MGEAAEKRSLAERAAEMLAEEQAIADQLAGSEPQEPQGLDIAPEEPIDANMEPVSPEVWSELRRRYLALPKGPDRNAGRVEADIGGKKYRYDRWGDLVAEGFSPSRKRGAVFNTFKLFFDRQHPERMAATSRARQEAGQERRYRRSTESMERYRQAQLEGAKYEDQLTSRNRTIDAIGRILDSLRDADAKLAAANIAKEATIGAAKIRAGASTQPKAMTPKDEAMADWYRTQAGALRHFVREGRTKGGAITGGKPKITAKDALTKDALLYQEQIELEDAIAKIQDQLDDYVPGNVDVSIGGEKFTHKADWRPWSAHEGLRGPLADYRLRLDEVKQEREALRPYKVSGDYDPNAEAMRLLRTDPFGGVGLEPGDSGQAEEGVEDEGDGEGGEAAAIPPPEGFDAEQSYALGRAVNVIPKPSEITEEEWDQLDGETASFYAVLGDLEAQGYNPHDVAVQQWAMEQAVRINEGRE